MYTIGQVSELIGINKRTPKYYIERDILAKKIIGQTVIQEQYFQSEIQM